MCTGENRGADAQLVKEVLRTKSGNCASPEAKSGNSKLLALVSYFRLHSSYKNTDIGNAVCHVINCVHTDTYVHGADSLQVYVTLLPY